MFPPRPPSFWLLLLIGLAMTFALLLTSAAVAQVDSIRANPDAVQLQSIWSRRGGGAGHVIAALPDITGDGRSEFAVQNLSDMTWRVHGLDSLGGAFLVWQHTFVSPLPLVHGNFFGDGTTVLVGIRTLDTAILGRLYWLDFHAVYIGRVADTPSMTWHSRTQGCQLAVRKVIAYDLDLDGADELIISAAWSWCGDVITENGEIWIFRGGEDFQIDTPTVVIRDNDDNGGFYDLHIGHVDDDRRPDLICVTRNGTRVRWGTSVLSELDRPADRTFGTINRFLDVLDADGDRQLDFLWYGAYLHLSSSGKDPHTRSFDGNDADRHFVGRGSTTFVAGPLNDSANRYDMFGTNTAMADRLDLVFSGGAGGPDAAYEAWFPGDANLRSTPLGDVDGNGWRDLLVGNDGFEGGSVVVFGGGPHIPRDSMPPSAIRDIAIDGRHAALTVWPNPARDVMHIAWRGDLGRTPERFTVYGALGRLVARGEADHMRGEVIWQCVERPPGVYFLSILDRDGAVIATTTIVKQ